MTKRIAFTPRSSLSVVLLSFVATSAHARDYVVDATGRTGTHRSMQAAVDASRDGDRILVVSTSQAAFKIERKAVWIVGSPTTPPQIGPVTIVDPPRNRALRISNVRIQLSALRSGTAGVTVRGHTSGVVIAENCDVFVVPVARNIRAMSVHIDSFSGHVLLQSCSTQGGSMLISGANRVTLNGCRMLGMPGAIGCARTTPPTAGGDVIRCLNSTIDIQRCSLTGGAGGLDWCTNTRAPGGRAIHATNNSLRVSGLSQDVLQSTPFSSVAIDLVSSKLEISGVRHGAIRADTASMVIRPTIRMPSIALVRPFHLGKNASFSFAGTPNQIGVVFLGNRTKAQTLPFGELFLDLTGWIHPIAMRLDGSGRGTVVMATGTSRSTLGLAVYGQGLQVSGTRMTLSSLVAAVVSIP